MISKAILAILLSGLVLLRGNYSLAKSGSGIFKLLIVEQNDQIFSTLDMSARFYSDTKSVILEKARGCLTRHFSSGQYRFDLQPRWIPNRLLQQSPGSIKSIKLQGKVKRYTNFEVEYGHRNSRKQAQIQLKVEVEQKVPVVTDRKERGIVLHKDDLKYQWVSLARNTGDYIMNIEMLAGKTLQRTLLSGQPIRRSFISREYIIETGDEVKVLIKRRGIQVQVSGEARENGAKGDRIKIYSSETRKKYVGEVIRPGVIQWKNTL